MLKLNWKDVLHYGSSLFLIVIAGATYFGVELPGVHVDAGIAFTTGVAGLGILGAGLKSDYIDKR